METAYHFRFTILSWITLLLEATAIEEERRGLEPIYWNTSNILFRQQNGNEPDITVDIDDKLDIICPRQGRDEGDYQHLYFKVYFVSEKNYNECSSAGSRAISRRLLTCDVPHQEKKYTFYFQEISPSPWGLEFKPDTAYYLISTSDGSADGINQKKGGACAQFNMKLKLMVKDKFAATEPTLTESSTTTTSKLISSTYKSSNEPIISIDTNVNGQTINEADDIETPIHHVTTDSNTIMNNGIVVGIILGACAVLFFVFLAFLGYKIYRRKRYLKKYPSPPTTRGSTPLQHVALIPNNHRIHNHPALLRHHHHSNMRLMSDSSRTTQSDSLSNRTDTLSSQGREYRPPPSYNESFMENGGPVVAV